MLIYFVAIILQKTSVIIKFVLYNVVRLREQAKAHQLADLIEDRNETIQNLAQVMSDVKEMTDDIRGQTRL